MKLKKLLSVILSCVLLLSSFSIITAYAETDTNQTEITESTYSTSEPTTVATETTEPTTEVTQPSTEVTEVTVPTTDSTETTAPTDTSDSTTATLPPTYSDKEVISGDYIYEVIMDNEIKIVDYFGTDTDVIVPAKIDGYDVTTIEGGAFICKANVESVTLPEGVRYIDTYAFYGCKNLRNVTLPNTLLIIEKAAFRCTQITDIEIPDSVGVIRSNAFARTKLRNIKIGRGINTIEDGALGEEKTLTITGYSNTEAEKYAIRNDVKFISIDEPQPTTPEGNVTFNVDEGVCARYERVPLNDDYLYIIY
ncbi:MAG: leucine-rich repeat domain-containing protein, partial [Ruminococcus sp.]